MPIPAKLQNLTTTPLQLIASFREGFNYEGQGILIPPGPDLFEMAPETYALLEQTILDLANRGFLAIVSPPADSRTSLQQLASEVLIVPVETFPVTGEGSFFLGKM